MGVKSKAKKNAYNIIIYIILILFSIIFLIPFLWMLSTSLKSPQEACSTVLNLIPKKPRWANYVEVFQKIPFLRYIFNTLFITIISVIGHVLTGSMVAYSMSKIDWWGKKYIFPIILATMMIPYQVTMIPVYMIWLKLDMVGTFAPLTIPTFTGGAFYIFLLRQFFMTIPNSIVDSSRLDGASESRIFWQIMLPLCKPAIASVAIFSFLNAWSDFLGPLLYLNKPEKYTLSLGLHAFLEEHTVQWGLLMAASTMFTVPIIIIFFLFQKQFIEGITLTGIKG
ncbi:MAG: carbohydrate ABC transporter permease [Xylanivirga thermophila]|jgi:multiple sugar transport system permease protein|uniref:carbohydrate ABC transporter permease n=1 Tax=Xylanivirga thermophila TaxID=2496273 RepID=UPI0039F59938